MLSIIDRYIAKAFLVYFLSGLLVFVTIFLAVDFTSSFVRYDVTADLLLAYYAYYIPGIAYQMVPVACLLATLFTLSTLSRNNEMVALFSMGFSLGRLSAPILAMIGLVSALSFWMGDLTLPYFAKKKNYTFYVEIRKKPSLYSTVKTDKIWYRSENVLFNIQTLDALASRAQGLTLYYFDSDWNLVQLIRSTAVFMKGEVWELSNGSITLFTEESSFPITQKFDLKKISMGEDISEIQTSAYSSETLSLGELKKFIDRNKEAGHDTLRYEVDYHAKYGFAFAAFVMSLLGIPFGVSRERSGGGFMNVAICMGLALGYWIIYSSAITMGRYGYLPPFLAAWGPNLLIGGISIYLLMRLKK